ncbi:MAG: HAD family hydrolase [Deltaproteobacteria bacterium]|nr:HAD family hydrolase [Deltaproteobacteria bacterium]
MKPKDVAPDVKCLLVDLDGTLLGAYDVFARIRFIRKMLWVLRKYGGWLVALKTLMAVQGVFKRSPRGRPRTNAEKAARVMAAGLKLPVAQSEKLMNDTLGGIFPTLKRFFYPMPGAREFLEWAKPRYPMVLATNPVWPLEIIEMRVKWAGIDPSIFRSITHARRMHSCKPELAYYRQILKEEGFEPRQCLLIGNDVKNDLPAVNAGIPVFVVTGKAGLKKITVPKGAAQAWSGDFKALRKFLA